MERLHAGDRNEGPTPPPRSGAGAVPASHARRPEPRFGLIVAAVFAGTLLPRILLHVFWRDELQAWMIAADPSPAFLTLLKRVSYEGHPFAWHAMLWLLAHVWPDPVAMKVLHVAIATGVAFVIAAFVPASRTLRVLLCASYFIAFEYAAISRNYSIGVLPLFGFVALRTWRIDGYVAQALCLAAAAQANAYAAMLAVVLSLWTGVQWLRAGRPHGRPFAIAVLILCASFVATALELIGPPDRLYAPDTSIRSRTMAVIAGLWSSFIPVPLVTRVWWNTNLLQSVVPEHYLHPAMALLGVAVLFAATLALPSRRDLRGLWLVGSGVLIAFGIVQFGGYLRHHGHFFVFFVVAWWLGLDRVRQATPVARRSISSLSVACLFAIQAAAGVAASIADARQPFSASLATANYIRANFPDAQVISKNDSSTSPVAGYLREPIFYMRTNRSGTYVVWDTVPRDDMPPTSAYTKVARRMAAASPGRPIVVVMGTNLAQPPDPRFFEKLASFEDATVLSERYVVYHLSDVRGLLASGTP